MKTFILSLVSVFFLTNQSFANRADMADHAVIGSWFNNNSIVFVENNIEFAVFPDGQFDFGLLAYGQNAQFGITLNNFSFNAGFNYNPYVQYDAFGAVIQIENTPVFYDHFGRVIQIGNIGIRYNRFGRLIGVGGLNVFFNNNVIVNYSGFINPFNRFYTFRPWHRFYALPAANYCVLYNRPYRLNYFPTRHVYYRPYVNNFRHSVVASRRAYTSQNGRISNVSNRYRQEARSARDRDISRAYSSRYGVRSTSTRGSDLDANNRNRKSVRQNSTSNVARSSVRNATSQNRISSHRSAASVNSRAKTASREKSTISRQSRSADYKSYSNNAKSKRNATTANSRKSSRVSQNSSIKSNSSRNTVRNATRVSSNSNTGRSTQRTRSSMRRSQ